MKRILALLLALLLTVPALAWEVSDEMIDFAAQHYRNAFHTLLVGTGDSPLTIPFYERCGFVRSHVVRDFFIDHYDHPIIEGGVQLRDMVYLKRKINSSGRKES